MNKSILVGRVCTDIDLKQTPKGVSVASFRVAVDRRFTSREGERQADFISIVAWRQQAEFVSKYFSKGNPISIDGSIQTRDYTDKDGNKRYAFEVVADHIAFVPGDGKKSAAPADVQADTSGEYQEVESEDDLPF